MPPPFPQDVQFQLQPAGPIVSFDSGPFQGRIYQNSGHIELAGPDLAGNANANLIHFAPPAAKTAQGPLTIGAVMSSAPVAGGVELKQKAGGAVVTTRLTFPHEGVMRYEVVDWGGIVPLATAVAAPCDNHEHFYGFGEKFDSFDQAGNKVHILTFDDPGVKKEHAYKVSPWFISTRGYGLHLDSSAESLFDMRAGAPDRYVITNLFGSLRLNIVYGPRLTDILTRYTGYTGRPPLSPPWTYGPWISSDIWRSGGEVRYAVTQFRTRGIPVSAFVFDSPWEIAYNDFQWNMTQFGKDATIDGTHFVGFSSFGEMMKFLQTNGLKVICWMAPFVNISSNNEGVPGQNLGKASSYDQAANQGLFVRASAGGPPLVVPWWKGKGSPIDFTNGAARQWLAAQLKNLVAQSAVATRDGGTEPAIGGFKTDDGETGNGTNTYIPVSAHYADGRTGIEMRNAYCVEYHRTVWNVLGEAGILFARSGFVGSHSFPSSWAGDNEPNFGLNGLPSVIIAGQCAAMSGYAIWGHDVGGYQDTNFSQSPANLLMRWTQFGCFSPIMQMHRQIAKEMQYPWRFGDEALNNYRFFAKLHTRLFPYIYTCAKIASTTGLPIIRPLVLLNQTDPNTFSLEHTYHFGNEFLAAPMITPDSITRQVYLPGGNWIDFWSHVKHAGGQSVSWTNANQSQFPLFVREGAVIPMLLMEPDSLCDANYANNAAVKTRDNDLLFLIFPGGNSGFTVYDGTDVQCRTEGGGIVITVSSSARRLQLQVLADAPAAVKRDGVTLPQLASAADFEMAGTGWRADPQTRLILVKFQHGGGNTTLEFN
jgi:alpha-D-xyloside xylohydrolase